MAKYFWFFWFRKTHLSKILEKKIDKLKILNAEQINNGTLENLNNYKCLIIDNFENNIEENLFYSILNQSKQLENFVVVNSKNSLKENKN